MCLALGTTAGVGSRSLVLGHVGLAARKATLGLGLVGGLGALLNLPATTNTLENGNNIIEIIELLLYRDLILMHA
jgi:hypothetical protein